MSDQPSAEKWLRWRADDASEAACLRIAADTIADLRAQLATARAALAMAITHRDPTAAVPLFDPSVTGETVTVNSSDLATPTPEEDKTP